MSSLFKNRTPVGYRYGEQSYRFHRAISLMHLKIDPNTLRENIHWLDLGCQIGDFIELVSAYINHKATLFGLDQFTEQELPEIASRFFGRNLNSFSEMTQGKWAYKSANFAQGIPIASCSMDIVTALEVIEHMIDTDFFFKEISRILVPNGYVILSTPNINSLRNRLTVPFGAYPAGLEYRNKIHHVRLYNPRMLISHASEYGFEVAAVSGVSFLPSIMLKTKYMATIDAGLLCKIAGLCNNFICILKKGAKSW